MQKLVPNSLCYPPWIPAPRFHEDKLRGNDPPEADRGLGCPPDSTAWNPSLTKRDLGSSGPGGWKDDGWHDEVWPSEDHPGFLPARE